MVKRSAHEKTRYPFVILFIVIQSSNLHQLEDLDRTHHCFIINIDFGSACIMVGNGNARDVTV